MSLRRRLQDYEKFARQAYSRKSGPSSGSSDGNSHASASGRASGNGSAQAGSGSSSSSGNQRTFHFTYWTSDGFRTVKREGYVRRDTGGKDDPWASFFRDGFFDREELERLERIRRMAEAFRRERAHYSRSYEKWQEGGEEDSDPQQGSRDDWTWTKTDWDAWKNADRGRFQTSQHPWKSPYAHHYKVLGLDPSRAGTYSEAEIKAAYRTKAMEYHPDRNQHRKDFAEAKFRDVVAAYEALKK